MDEDQSGARQNVFQFAIILKVIPLLTWILTFGVFEIIWKNGKQITALIFFSNVFDSSP